MDDFKKDIKYFEQELQERETQSDKYIHELPQQMNKMFKHLEATVDQQETSFY
jgi:hypothetical protein